MKSLLIIGAGGHGEVVQEVALSMVAQFGIGYEKIAFLDDDAESAIGPIKDLESFAQDFDDAFCAIGNNAFRKTIIERIQKSDCQLATLVHPSAYVSPSATIEPGTIIEPNAIVHANAHIEQGCIISVGAIIDHDAHIGAFSHINAGAICIAGSTVPAETKVGAGEIVPGFTTR